MSHCDASPDDRAARFDRLLAADGAALARVASAYEADRAVREDLLQEVLLAIWQALPRFRGEASLRTFVFRIAHNRGLSHAARRRSSQGRTAGPATAEEGGRAEERMLDPAPGPEERLAADQRRRRLRRAVRALPLTLRQPLVLRLEGMSHRQIAAVLGISENNAAVRLTRARAALKDRLAAGPLPANGARSAREPAFEEAG